MSRVPVFVGAALLSAAPLFAQPQRGGQGLANPVQGSNNPFTNPIATEGRVTVNVAEFASIPDAANNEAARVNLLLDEPATRRLFVNTMRGLIYSVSYDGKTVTEYLDLNAHGVPVNAQGTERGFQSFAFHPQFNQRGARGYGKFYTWTDTSDMTPAPDFSPSGQGRLHDEVLFEWTAKDPVAPKYDGGAPRELFRVAHPFGNHNGGQIAFNPLAQPNAADYGLLYIGSADGGSGGDPFNHGQDLKSVFGKILRIDPLGTNSKNGKYGIPSSNPFVSKDALGEIYAYGVRNPQRFSWDARNGRMYVADIGQNIVEEVSPVPAGGNLGWNKWEGSFLFGSRAVEMANPRSDPSMVFPVAEFDHTDPLLRRAAVTGVVVYRGTAIRSLQNKIIFGDNPSGEVFFVDADNPPNGGQDPIRRVLFNDKGTTKTLLQLIREKNVAQGKPEAPRADLRFGIGQNNTLYVLNKRDGTIRQILP